MNTDAWQAALAAEHAAVYGYGAVGAHVRGTARADVVAAETAHRGRRDALSTRLGSAGLTPAAAAPAYTLPFRVVDAPAAFRLAVELEEGTARAWRAAVAALEGSDRHVAAAALGDCAVRAARWRHLSAPATPATVAFPGT
jgi:hypothetical protein